MSERIKRAMELARRERSAAASVAHTTAPAASVSAPVPATDGAASSEHVTITVSEATLKESRLLLPGMVGDAAHGFRLLRTHVLQRMQQRDWNTLAILSAGPDEGKTILIVGAAANTGNTTTMLKINSRINMNKSVLIFLFIESHS